ncbi:MAG: InlB B-repeat-containing protein [Treponema porcinum]|nr:InlB B-repeat-containing protein [Treponema porcinum]MDY4525662.1 InlB B-repeat-containing protein [Treponema sp.]
MRKHFGKWLMLILSGVFLFFVMSCAAESSGGSSDGGSSSKSITVTYVDESGNVLDSKKSTTWIILDYKKTGYISTYFDSDGIQINSPSFPSDSDCTITVKFTPIKYTVKFEKASNQYGTFSDNFPEQIKCVYDEEFTLPENNLIYTYSNQIYKSYGWTTNSYSWNGAGEYSGGEKLKNLSNKDGAEITFYPCFSNANLFKLTFYQSETSYSPLSSVYAAENEIIDSSKVPTAASKTGYSFDGWYLSTDSSQTVVDFSTYEVTGDATFYAKFKANTYTATFVTEYGTAPEPLKWTYSTSYSESTDITTGKYVITATGYDFDGWYEEGESYQTYYIYHKTANNITLTAKWTPWTATVYYKSNNSSARGSMYDTTVTYSTATTLSKNGYYLAGYEFTGWNTKADGTGTAYADEASYVWTGTQKGEKINLYAQWKPIQTKMTVSISAPSSDSDLQLSYDSVLCAFNAALSGASVFTWYVDGIKVENETSSSLSAYVLSEGQHSVMVTSDIGGKTYGQTLSVNVTVTTSEE